MPLSQSCQRLKRLAPADAALPYRDERRVRYPDGFRITTSRGRTKRWSRRHPGICKHSAGNSLLLDEPPIRPSLALVAVSMWLACGTISAADVPLYIGRRDELLEACGDRNPGGNELDGGRTCPSQPNRRPQRSFAPHLLWQLLGCGFRPPTGFLSPDAGVAHIIRLWTVLGAGIVQQGMKLPSQFAMSHNLASLFQFSESQKRSVAF